jgi:hypothetical protein
MLKTKANHSTERKKTYFSLNSNLLIEELPKNVNKFKGEVIIDGEVMMTTDVTKGLYFVFMSYYAFSLQYEKPFEDILVSIERLFLHWTYSEVSQSVDQVIKNLLF